MISKCKLSLLLISFIGLVSCGDSTPLVVKKSKLIEPLQTIKEDYYQQMFYDKGITTFGYEDESQTTLRPLTIDSFYLSRLYGVFNNAYMVDFYINNYGRHGWNMVGSYTVNDEHFSCYSMIEPIVWKEHRVYTMQEAVDENVVSMDDLRSRSYQNIVCVETLEREYLYNLPTFDDKKNETAESINKINEDSNYARIKKDYYNQHFVKNNITDDHEFSEYYQPRPVNENSIGLYRYYGKYNGAYLVSMMINGHTNRYNYYGGYKYEYNNEVVYFIDTNEPIVWKDGLFYDMESAVNSGLISPNDILALRKYSDVVIAELIETWSVEYASKLP